MGCPVSQAQGCLMSRDPRSELYASVSPTASVLITWNVRDTIGFELAGLLKYVIKWFEEIVTLFTYIVRTGRMGSLYLTTWYKEYV